MPNLSQISQIQIPVVCAQMPYEGLHIPIDDMTVCGMFLDQRCDPSANAGFAMRRNPNFEGVCRALPLELSCSIAQQTWSEDYAAMAAGARQM